MRQNRVDKLCPAADLEPGFFRLQAQPKEMLPVVDKPVIQYVVEEAVVSGSVTSLSSPANKRAIEIILTNHSNGI